MQPTLHVKVWGGRRLAEKLGKTLPTDQPYGEAWELHDSARAADGALAGQTLGDLARAYGAALIGDNDPALGVPLLAKFLDANDWLSVQVHPDDAQAAHYDGEPRGKTEAWYVLAADPGAKLCIGVQHGTSRESLAAAIRENRVEPLLVYAEVVPGDVLFVRPNTIHALGPGVLIYEIQQSSDLTYRLYDWGRTDLNGTPRTLHIDKGVAVANTESLPPLRHTGSDPSREIEIVRCDYFVTVLHQLTAPHESVEIAMNGRFHMLTCIEGALDIADAQGNTLLLQRGESAFMPASLGSFIMHGTAKVLRAWQPE
jgi:mannose-6-phosphate isomerase